MDKIKVFCLEDDLIFAKLLKYRLSLDPEFEVKSFHTAKDLIDSVSEVPDIITVDINLPDMQGSEVINKVREHLPNVTILVISGQEDIKVAASLFRMEIYDYIIKDDNTLDRLWNVVHNIAKQIYLEKEVVQLRQEVKEKQGLTSYIKGESNEMQKVFSKINKTTSSNINVIISGETGTGKELVAKTIHSNSKQKQKPFIAVNVAAIPKDLLESELFGHEKGSFTGAYQQRIGKFEEARGGTLFLDEIGEMELTTQAKLLRVLQEMELTRVGGNNKVILDFRLIIATHRNLQQEVRDGNFRDDLFYRLMGLSIELPPLRVRGKDVILLAKYFAHQFAKKNDLPPKKISNSALRLLTKYSFPGNVRELKAVIETAFVISENDELNVEDIQLNSPYDMEINFSNANSLEEYTIAIIQKHLKDNDNNVLRTARKLDVGKSTIYRLIKEGKLKN